jgi:eukaryotic-like serine/threonine-protein kinase
MSLEGMQLGRYRLLRLLGSGGMGEVYLAEDAGIARQVAIKVIRGDVLLRAGSEDASNAIRLFQREMRMVAGLNHPHILPLYDYGEANVNGVTLPYMVMPYGEDGSLAAWLKQRGDARPLPLHDVAAILQQAADALQYAHDRQVIHRDIKPQNFIIRLNRDHPDRPDVSLADFGLARLTGPVSSASLAVAGSPQYMAPEQWRGNPVPATDQYMLAVMVYELLVGRPPFHGTLERLIYQHLQEQPEAPGRINPRVPARLDAVMLRALAKEPEARFPGVSTFASAFHDALRPADAPVSDTYATVSDIDVLFEEDRQQSGSQVQHEEKRPALPSMPSQPAELVTPTDQPILRGAPNQTTVPEPGGRGISMNVAAGKRGFRCSIVFFSLLLFLVVGAGSLPFLLGNHGGGASQNTTGHTPAAALTQNPYPPHSGTLVLNDPLRNNNQGYEWDVQPTVYGTCRFVNGAYHVAAPTTPFYHSCAAHNTHFTNFAYEVQMMIVSGNCGAIIFRADFQNFRYYYFRICANGSYKLLRFTSQNTSTPLLQQVSSPFIHRGLGQINTMAVVANGNNLMLFVNHSSLGTVPDTLYSKQGQIGVAADNDTSPTEVIFSNAKVWTI